ncbi:alpha/beta fold hydrolase [Candidatus Uhrbacteria bacterium]|nr:alpha/beta fold hydrolase [Candidatus Uhrbacteria bacterium]
MEQEVKIKTKDGKTIYGFLRGSVRKPVVVFVHGLLGSMHQHIFYNGARFFERHGFSSFRFNLYDWRRGARKLHECTLEVHAADLDLVIEYLRSKGARKVFAVGHSYGGPTILMSKKKQYDAVVLWDSSYGQSVTFKKARYLKELDAYMETWSHRIIFGKKMAKEANQITPAKSRALIQELRIPVKIVVAEKGILVKGGKQYFSAANSPKSFAIVKGADHSFNRAGNEEALFRETLVWLRKWR